MPSASSTDTRRVAALGSLFAPSSVAVIGASADPQRIGGRPIAYMRQHGFQGSILPVNPNRPEVQGYRAVARVADLPKAPDVGVVAVPGDAAIQAIEDLGALGTRAAIVFSSGFAEAGPAGAAMQQRLAQAAASHGIRLLGPNCAGMFNARIGFYPIFASVFAQAAPPRSRVGMAGQSGAFCTHLYAAARLRGLGIDICVTTGNEMDVDVADALQWLVDDPEVDVIAAYSEGFRDGGRLVRALEAARRARKPVVMMKVGASAVGAEAIQSHTAAIAGNDRIAEAVLGDLGVVRARSIEHMLDVTYAATRRIYPVSGTLGVLSISGGVGVLIADAAAAAGIPMPEMSATAQAEVRQMVPFASPRNPVDCTAQAINDPAVVGKFADVLVREGYASVLAFFSTGGGAPMAQAIREGLTQVQAAHADRLWVMSQIAGAEEAAAYERAGFLCFEDPSRAVAAIEAMGRFGKAFARPAQHAGAATAAVAVPRTTLNEAQAKSLLANAGIAFAPERVCSTVQEAVEAARDIGYPVVMKILSPDILHKSDIGGVLLDLADDDAVRQGFERVTAAARAAQPDARIDGVLVARQLRNGIECIMGTAFDPAFGPVAMFGLGGIFVEVLQDVVFKRCPFGEDAAREMVLGIKSAAILQGARGVAKADIGALAHILSRLSHFAASAGPDLASVDLNPVLALPDGQGAYAVDAVVVPARS